MADGVCTEFAAGFATQAEWCRLLGSPFSAAFLDQAADDVGAGNNVVARYMAWWDGVTRARFTEDVLALRFLGAAHALALGGDAAALAARYPSCGGDGDADGIWRCALEAFEANAAAVRDFLTRPPQTNEVARAGALMPGLLEIARLTGLPLALYEIGASAGLLQGLDRFHYTFGDATWGDSSSPCRMTPAWPRAALPPVDAPLAIAARRASDITPLDIGDPAGALRVKAYVWADQTARLARLEGALAIARDLDVRVEAASADRWLEDVLGGAPAAGTVRVVMHAVMWQYMPDAVRARATQALHAAGARASADAPLAWLRLEPAENNKPMQVALALWRGGEPETRVLARAHPHGAEIGWFGWDAGEVLPSPDIVQTFG